MDPQWRKRNVDPQESLKNKDQSYSRDKPLKMFFFFVEPACYSLIWSEGFSTFIYLFLFII